MELQTLTSFFLWCTVINGGLLILSFLFCVVFGDWVYRMHRRWFAMPRETFTVVLYALIGGYKILFIVFNLVPWVVLVMLG